MKILTERQIEDAVFNGERFVASNKRGAGRRAIAQAQLDQDKIDGKAECLARVKEIVEAYEHMLDGVGKGEDDFKKSDWDYLQALKEELK